MEEQVTNSTERVPRPGSGRMSPDDAMEAVAARARDWNTAVSGEALFDVHSINTSLRLTIDALSDMVLAGKMEKEVPHG